MQHADLRSGGCATTLAQCTGSASLEIDDIFTVGKAKARASIEQLAQSRTCPEGLHPLVSLNTPKAGYYCNVCGKEDISKGTLMFGCRQCDWDW